MQVRKILLVDDEPHIRQVCQIALEDCFAVMCGSSGLECLAMAETFNPDLILLDVRMPKMSGKETLERLKKNNATRDIPVIFLTASIQNHEVHEYRKMDVIGIIEKPFDPLKLGEAIMSISGVG